MRSEKKNNIEIYKDAECSEIFKSLGDIDIDATKEIPIFIKNIGKTNIVGISVDSTYPDTKIIGKIFPLLEPNEVVKYTLIWTPSNKTMEIFKSGKKRSGGILVSAKEVIE